jgi:hypothetical protein
MKKLIFVLLILVLLSSLVYAHSGDVESSNTNIDHKDSSITYILIASIIIIVLTLLSFKKKLSESLKWFLFIGISISILLPSIYLIWSTVSLNLASESNGPVHWHADFEIWNCDEKWDLKNPTGLTNRIGTTVFHEHNDDRIHVEGTLLKTDTVDLHSFFEVIGGDLDDSSFTIESNEGKLSSGGCEGELQIFAYNILDEKETPWRYVQEKVSPDYILSPHTNIPPGDCIIIEFGEQKDKTDKMCETYKIAIEKGKLNEAQLGIEDGS